MTERSNQLLSASTAKFILLCRDGLKLEPLNVCGKCIVATEVFNVKQDKIFCVLLEKNIHVLVKNRHLDWQETLVPGNSYVFTSLRPTTLQKGAGEAIKLFVPSHDSQVFPYTDQCGPILSLEEWKSKFSSPTIEVSASVVPASHCTIEDSHITYQGEITNTDDGQLGVYEVDNKIRLYTCYVPASLYGFKVGNKIKIHNVHLHKSLQEPRIRLICCMHTCVKLTESTESGSRSKIPKCFQLVLWKKELTADSLCEVMDSVVRLRRKLNFINIEKFAEVILYLDSILIEDQQQKSRNHLQEALSIDRDCFKDAKKDFGYSFPDICDVGIMEAEQKVNSFAFAKHDVNKDWNTILYWNFIIEKCPEQQILIGEVHLSSKSGQIQIRDSTGTVYCVVMETGADLVQYHTCDIRCCQCQQMSRSKFTCPFFQAYHNGCLVAITKYHVVMERFLSGMFTDIQTPEDIRKNTEQEKWRKYIVFSFTDTFLLHMHDNATCSKHVNQGQGSEVRSNNNVDTGDRILFINHKESLRWTNKCTENQSFVFICHVCDSLHSTSMSVDQSKQEKQKHAQTDNLQKEVSMCSKCQLLLFQGKNVRYYHSMRTKSKYCFKDFESVMKAKSRLPWQLKQSARKAGDFMCHVLPEGIQINRQFHQMGPSMEITKSADRIEDILSEQFDKDFVNVIGRIVRRVHIQPDVIGITKRLKLDTKSGDRLIGTLDDWQIQLQVKCVLSDSEISVYLKLDSLSYPLGLVPGSVVHMEQIERRLSRRGVVYCQYSTVSCLMVIHHQWSSYGNHVKEDNCNTDYVQPDTKPLNRHRLSDVWQDGSIEQFICIGFIQKVVKISMKCVCQICGSVVITQCSNTACGSEDNKFVAKMSVILDDSTSVAMVTCTDIQVQVVLGLSNSQWESVISAVKHHGEIFIQQTFPEFGTAVEKFIFLLCDNPQTKQPMKWSLQCKQMNCHGNQQWRHPCDLLNNMSLEDFPEKSVDTGITTIKTKCLPFLQLGCVSVNEVDYRELVMIELRQ